MTFNHFECVVGEIRGFRWWRVTPRGWLRSPWHSNGRWEAGPNPALCMRPDGSHHSHLNGSPEVACTCGIYALHALPADSPEKLRNPWGIAATASGDHGLVFGVAAGHGHVLVGTTGWRAERARVLALYLGLKGRSAWRLNVASRRYSVPIYTNLEALVVEWGPDGQTRSERRAS